MAWIYLITAGALEVAWAAALKKLGLGFNWTLAVLAGLTMAASLLALYAAMTRLPLGIAYLIWTGIGSVGSVIISVFLFNQTLSPIGATGIACLVLGMFLIGAGAH